MENQPAKEPSAEEKDKEYCKKESDEAYTTILKAQEEYDKQLLTLSTGLLAVIMAFIKDVVHLDSSICRPLLYCGLAGLGVTVVCVISSFQVSVFILTKVREYWNQRYNGNIGYEFPERLGRIMAYINWAGGLFFILGIGLTLAFIIANLAHTK